MPQYSQKTSPMAVGTSLGEDKLLLTEFTHEAGVSEPFTIRFRALSEEKNLNIKSLLRTQATIRLNLNDDPDSPSVKHLNGKVIRAAVLEESEYLTEYEVEMVSWFTFLKFHRDCKIFQEKNAQEIIEEIFGNLGYSDFKFDLQGTPKKREYCVQYRESTFDFVSRLLEEEGYWYFFKHEDGKHTMIIGNANAKFPMCSKSTLHYDITKSSKWEEEITEIDFQRIARTSVETRRDYNFEDPSLDLTATITASFTAGSEEFYDYPGMYVQKSHGDDIVALMADHQDSHVTRVNFQSKARAITCGCRLNIADHFHSDANEELYILALNERCSFAGYRSQSVSPGEELKTFRYENRATAGCSADSPYRPPRKTTIPMVRGVQTAVVVGPSGEEIYTDKYGRIKVQFHWDREGKKDENSSCWIRFSTSWAGKQWGMISIPRIGQEVVVDFLEGHPDRPLVTGCVYNAEQMPPYSLPGNATQSGLKSRSSKGGGGDNFNEIRFEDKKGSEDFSMQAEKDMNILVKNDRNITIRDGNDTLTVKKGDKSVSVEKGGHTTKIKKDHKTEVDANIDTLAKGDIKEEAKGNFDMKGGKNVTIEAGMNMTIKAGTQITIQAGSGKIVLNAMGVTITGTLVKIN
ncbi:MAG: type VI secretion system tip protein VgrG [Bryobacterales bacterium]|nr:type VI secretion system tip protein VgrG [Bryobacterales bacterium]